MATAYLTTTDYTFPIYDSTIDVNPNLSKEALLQNSLKLRDLFRTSPPIRSSCPINSILNHQLPKKEDPLQDILNHSRARLHEYNEHLLKERPVAPPPINTSSIRVPQRSTPTSNKIMYFSPSGKGKSSTPITKRKSSVNLKQRLLKMDQALIIKDISIHNDYNEEADESDYDRLACHADNIMRMAVDSTMLGSTFNSSFSSSFSNSFIEPGRDFLDKEAKRTILEGLNF